MAPMRTKRVQTARNCMQMAENAEGSVKLWSRDLRLFWTKSDSKQQILPASYISGFCSTVNFRSNLLQVPNLHNFSGTRMHWLLGLLKYYVIKSWLSLQPAQDTDVGAVLTTEWCWPEVSWVWNVIRIPWKRPITGGWHHRLSRFDHVILEKGPLCISISHYHARI